MVQKSPNKIYKKFILFFAAFSILLFSGFHADASDILEQANQAYELKNYDKARELYLKAAEEGDAEAQKQLGNIYSDGKGVPQDFDRPKSGTLKQPRRVMRKLKIILGMYLNGEGVPQNFNKALEWFVKAAEQGLAVSQLVGTCMIMVMV